MFFIGGTYVYGAEKTHLAYMKYLKDAGYEVKNISNAWNDGVFHGMLKEAGIPYQSFYIGKISKTIYPFKYLWWTINALLHLPLALIRLRKEIRRFQPDLCVFNNPQVLFLVKPLLKSTKILFVHNEKPGNNYFFRKSLIHPVLPTAHLAISGFIQRETKALGIHTDMVHLVYNSVEVPAAVPDLPKKEWTIGCIGQIGEWKGQEDLIEALAILKKTGNQISCFIKGRGDIRFIAQLEQKISANDLSHQIYWKDYSQDIASFFEKINLLVVPSRVEEAFGRTAAEAGAYGLPAIVSNRGGLPEIVQDGETGLIFQAENPDQLAKKIQYFYQNPQEIKRMGQNGRKRVLDLFSPDRQKKDFLRLIEQLI